MTASAPEARTVDPNLRNGGRPEYNSVVHAVLQGQSSIVMIPTTTTYFIREEVEIQAPPIPKSCMLHSQKIVQGFVPDGV